MLLGSPMLEVGIGLVFLYLLLSMVVSTLSELIARALALRSNTLRDGLDALLGSKAGGEKLLIDFYNHPFIKGLGKNSQPSYIAARTFSLTLLDLVAAGKTSVPMIVQDIDGANVPDDLKKQLKALATRAGDDYDKYVASIEQWFDEDMQRVSGWYKRKSQLICVALGLVLTILINADSFAFATGLIQNSAAREAFVSSAAAVVSASPAPATGLPAIDIPKAQQELSQAGLAIGWNGGTPYQDRLPSMLVGWLVTAAAVSLGAPFWFDLLTRLVNIRTAGPIPSSSATEAQP